MRDNFFYTRDTGKGDLLIRVLLVDDEPALFPVTKLALEKDGDVLVDLCASPAEARTLLEKRHYEVIISDYDMPGEDGITFLCHLRESGDDTPFIIFTGKGNETVAMEACNAGVDYYLTKSGSPREVFHRLKECVMRASRGYRHQHPWDIAFTTPLGVLETLPVPVFVLDERLHIRYLNRSATRISGLKTNRQELLSFNSILDKNSSRELIVFLEHVIGGSESRDDAICPVPLVFMGPDGRCIHMECSILPARDENGRPTGFVVTCNESMLQGHG